MTEAICQPYSQGNQKSNRSLTKFGWLPTAWNIVPYKCVCFFFLKFWISVIILFSPNKWHYCPQKARNVKTNWCRWKIHLVATRRLIIEEMNSSFGLLHRNLKRQAAFLRCSSSSRQHFALSHICGEERKEGWEYEDLSFKRGEWMTGNKCFFRTLVSSRHWVKGFYILSY